MLLNLGLTADAAAAHAHEPNEPETQTSPACSPTFSLSALPLWNSFYPRPKTPDGFAACPGVVSAMEMRPTDVASGSGPMRPASAVARPQAVRSTTDRKSRPKTAYQFAHPAAHARHKRLRFRPKLLLQLQQVSQTPRPLPVVDVLPSTSYLPLLARKFPAIYRTRNGLGPNDVVVVISEQYEQSVASIPEKRVSSEDEDEDHREVVATICQKLQEDARLKGKAEICLNFGPVWEATPLPSGSYEFVAQTDNGVQVVRWALRSGRSRRMTAPSGGPTAQREGGKRFTFSVIDPSTRRHPVIASLTRNQLEVHDEYSMPTRSGTGPTTPSSGMSVASDASDGEAPLNSQTVTLDDGLRTLIIITGIWVAFREGWSDNLRYGDPVSATGAKSLMSPTASKHTSPTTAKMELDSFPENEPVSPVKEVTNGAKRCMSMSKIRRSNTPTLPEGDAFGSLSKRSNSTGAAFMDRAKRRSASGLSTRVNRHSMFTSSGEIGREIVVSRPTSRPPSIRQSSVESGELPQSLRSKERSPTKTKANHEIPTVAPRPDKDLPSTSRTTQKSTPKEKALPHRPEGTDAAPAKSKRRNRLSSFFGLFHRKHDTH
ncbi:unnamed protein product [Penicillium salamii]|uniref:Uncharacterized protein n=1 Tax=Penicillium salamii TaxID=1612424 RepID=A0A9W4N7F4_9EURO|nr:unnamed protein product [Penicillium salamii]CAG8170336.1 unnamed protein product [Penicillium salamii]CAG8200206.1 unnamed protein product [Penicillium salamii]CAG8214570.1 unnamed protein product [Penicillium salamii]CAG8231405.1 unnamed protein product [Penicillium salamii]